MKKGHWGVRKLCTTKFIKAFTLFLILKTHWKIQFANLNSKRKRESVNK